RTTHALKVGEEGEAISIPVVEGENERADRNRRIGALNITSAMIKRDLAAGSEVELTLKINESRIITVNAYVPILDEEFEETLDLRKTKVSAEAIEADLQKEIERLRDLIRKAEEAQDQEAVTALEKIESSALLSEIKDAVAAARGDPDA